MNKCEVMWLPMGDLVVVKRISDGAYSATILISLWNEMHRDCKTVDGFVEDESKFYAEFFGDKTPRFLFDEDGNLWLEEPEFRDLLTYLSPELTMVDYIGV